MYDDFETNTSYKYLKIVVDALTEPICLLGGWAVYLQVTKDYKEAVGRDYLGSRDIDLGFHFTPGLSEQEMRCSPLAQSIKAITKLGFEPLSFRYVKDIDRETGQPTEAMIPLFRRFQMAVDLIVDYQPKRFKSVFGFNPICEPLLKFAFEGNSRELVEFEKKLLLPSPSLLLATKLNSIQYRDKYDKRIKDLCDIYALLWHSGDTPQNVERKARQFTTLKLKATAEDIGKAAAALGQGAEAVEKVINVLR